MKRNAYQVTAKLVPSRRYKPKFLRGICFAGSVEEARMYVRQELENEIILDVGFRIEIPKVSKLHSKFVLNAFPESSNW